MRKFTLFNFIFIGLIICNQTYPLYAQMDELYGDQEYSTYGVHSGNQLRTFFWNDGQIGRRKNLTSIPQVGGEWPINSGHITLAKMATWFGSEVRCTDGIVRHIVSESNGSWTGDPNNGSSGDADADTGEWWSMTPLPGFYNPNPPQEESNLPWIAMSHKKWSWPDLWPDKMVDNVDPGWSGSWNGYFGKNLFNADQESFYMMDDWHNKEFPFYPDANDTTRRGLGLRVTVRGLQWSHVMVEDMIFWLFDAENIGTHLHDKVVFGIMCGPDIGGEGDGSDDGGAYDLETDLGYQYDDNNIGTGGYTPVEILGLAFLESPGNPYDGIDNDGDGKDGPGPILPEDVNAFATRMVNTGDDIVLINYDTFERTISTMPADGAKINYLGRERVIMPGLLVEEENNLIDDNLNGLIDENNGSTYGEGDLAIDRRLYSGLKYIDYFTMAGSDNVLIDEERDDGIDNDGDWNVLFDDVGLDGVADTGDPGEGDGVPTSGAGTGLPGEPNIDATDIDESDQIGLTSFFIYAVSEARLTDDERLWETTTPGVLNAQGQIGNTDVILGSGYFPIKPKGIERFSFSYMYGYPLDDLIRNKVSAQKSYGANYNFAKAPAIPTLYAIPEDGRVTLYWDDVAEGSYDPISGYDFEGYRLYRSTDQEWNDMATITDAYGTGTGNRKPIAQFDLDNGITGFSQVAVNGVQFVLGDDTGLVHSFVDNTVKNGYTYYYALTAYDSGVDSTGLYPSECSKYISVSPDGSIDKGKNVVIVKPEAAAAGFVAPKVETAWLEGSKTDGNIEILVLDKTTLKDETFQVTFEDTLIPVSAWLSPSTKNFNLINVTDESSPDTLIKQSTQIGSVVSIPGISNFRIMLENSEDLDLNADSSGWRTRDNIYDIRFRPAYNKVNGIDVEGIPKASNYRIEIGEPESNSSTEYSGLPSVPANFKIYNTTEDEEIKFIFDDRNGKDGIFNGFGSPSWSDRIYFLEEDETGALEPTWCVELLRNTDTTITIPESGDVFEAILYKPFLSHDVFEFKTIAAKIDEELEVADLENIKVVPNPYIVGNSWEPRNQYSTGRGPRELHFTNLPQKCTIRIFNIRGLLVETLEHEDSMWNGTEVWNMLTKDKLDIAFGVYVYHVEAPGVGTKVGKFAVIK